MGRCWMPWCLHYKKICNRQAHILKKQSAWSAVGLRQKTTPSAVWVSNHDMMLIDAHPAAKMLTTTYAIIVSAGPLQPAGATGWVAYMSSGALSR